jgi:hypothetical protein
MYSNRVYNAKVDAPHFVEGLIIVFWTCGLFFNQCRNVYIGVGCVDIRRTQGNVRVRR